MRELNVRLASFRIWFRATDSRAFVLRNRAKREASMPSRDFYFVFVATALIVIPLTARASEWNYGCKGALPVFDESKLLFFNREILVLLPKSWLNGTLRDLINHDLSDDVAIAKAKDENSGLAQNMEFTLLDHPDRKLTLTEKSSKTISDVRVKTLGPRYAQTTTYAKLYH